MTRPFFTKDRIAHFELFGRHADDAISLLKNRLREGHAVDIQDLVGRFTLDSATEFLLGQCVDILKSVLPYSPNLTAAADQRNNACSDAASRFAKALGSAQVKLGKRTRLGYLWPLSEFWKDNTEDDMKVVNEFIDSVVKGKASSTGKEIGDGETLLDHLITYTKGEHRSD